MPSATTIAGKRFVDRDFRGCGFQLSQVSGTVYAGPGGFF